MLPNRLPSLASFIAENFKVEDGVLIFDPNDKSLNINTKFGGGRAKKGEPKLQFQPRRSTLGDKEVVVTTAYNRIAKSQADTDLLADIMTSLKGKGPYTIDQPTYQDFIHRTAMYMRQLIGLQKVDLILTCESRSPLVDDLAAELSRLMGGRADTIYKAVSKNHALDTIHLADNDPRMTPNIRKNLEGILRQSIKNGYFEIKAVGQPQYRKFLENWLEVSHELAKELDGKHIVLLDDYLTSGSTLLEGVRALNRFNVASIQALTILK